MKKRILFHAAILSLLLIVLGASFAMGENVTILTVSEDHLESIIDSNTGVTAQQMIEAYVHALEARGDEVRVLGSVRTNFKGLYTIYATGASSFDWAQGDTARNEAYYNRTLNQLANADFGTNRVVIFTGTLQNQQAKRTARETYLSTTGSVPVIVYGLAPLPRGKSAADAYQEASGVKLEGYGTQEAAGFTGYQNTLIKENAAFDAAQTLDDLLSVSFSGKLVQQDENTAGLLIPETMISQSVLMLQGTNLADSKLIVNNDAVYSIVTDKSGMPDNTLFGAPSRWGQEQALMISLPADIHGEIKITGQAGGRISLYYIEDSSYAEKLQNVELCPEGIEYGEDGSVWLRLSKDAVIQDLKLVHPELSFQAEVTILETGETFSLYAEKENEIHWSEVSDKESEIVITLRSSRDGQELTPAQRVRYTPITNELNRLEPVISMRPTSQPVKREEIIFIISFPNLNGSAANGQRITRWLSQAQGSVKDAKGEIVGSLSYDEENNSLRSTAVTMPGREGDYFWNITISGHKDYVLPWEKAFSTKTVTILNNAPKYDPEKTSAETEYSVQPGASADHLIPAGLFEDPDRDPLQVKYTLLYNGNTVREDSVDAPNGISPDILISDLNQFGDWSVSLTAIDEDGASSPAVENVIHIVDGNTAPKVVSEYLPEKVTEKSLLRLSDYLLVVPQGLFSDAEQDSMTIHVKTINPDNLTESYTFKAEDGVSGEWTHSLDAYGTWRIELYAEDEHGKKSDTVSYSVILTDTNTAPHVDSDKIPEKEQNISVLRASDYSVAFPKGFYTDDEHNNLTVYVTLTDPNNSMENYNFKGKDGLSAEWALPLNNFGTWKIDIYAVDELKSQSPTISYSVTLTDALSELPGTVKLLPEDHLPEKGDRIQLELNLEWPEEYRDLPLREWLENCDVSATDNYGATYVMTLAESELKFLSEEIIMPSEETELIYSVTVASREGAEPQKSFNQYNAIEVNITNSAPAAVIHPIGEETKYVFGLNDFSVHIPSGIFQDAENDDFTVDVSLVNEKEEISKVATIGKTEEHDLNFPEFGKWEIRLTATDSEGSSSDPFVYAQVTLHNLTMIVMIAGAALIILITILIIVLRIRYKKNLPRYEGKDYIVFRLNGKNVSREIKMPEGDTRSFPIATFAVSISILLSDAQWSVMKQWMICPTRGDKPAFRKMGTKDGEDKYELDLGGDLKALINPR